VKEMFCGWLDVDCSLYEMISKGRYQIRPMFYYLSLSSRCRRTYIRTLSMCDGSLHPIKKQYSSNDKKL